jgi:hypothetical protein
MSYHGYEVVPRALRLPERFDELASRLRALAARVRLAASEAVGGQVAGLVTDALARLWGGHEPAHERRRGEYGWSDDEPEGRWDDEPPAWDEPADRGESRSEESAAVPRARLVGVALQGAGWWLGRRGGWAGACAAGLLAGGLALLGGRSLRAGLGLVVAAGQLLALDRLLAPVPAALGAD